MKKLYRLKNKFTARLANKVPSIADRLIAAHEPEESVGIPWTPVKKQVAESQIAIVTTAGLHHNYQSPFNMLDPMGDPSYRIIDTQTIEDDYAVTHDYYDHRGADKDLNVIFPITRLLEMADAGVIGGVSRRHFSFMGHIKGLYLDKLVGENAPQVAAGIKEDQVDAVILTPG